MEQVYDVAIIGGGMGGLTVGNYLAQQGLKTVIYEAQDHAGGYVTSFQRGKFTFDAGVTSFGSNGIVFPILDELGLGELAFHRVKRQLVTEEWSARVDGSFAEVRAELKKSFPEEGEQVDQFFDWLEMATEGFRQLFANHIFLESWREAAFDLIQLPFREMEFCKFLWRGQHLTDRQIHRRYFQDQKLLDFLDHLGYPIMSGLVAAGMWYSFKEDYWYPSGGMGKFRDQLLEKYLAAGGEICYQTEVAQILLEERGRSQSQSRGLRLADGQEVGARHVVSNINPRDTYLKLIGEENLQSELVEKIRYGKTSESICSLYLGLRGKGFAQSQFPLEASHHTFYLRDEIGRPQEFAMYILTNEDSTLAPDGEVVVIHCFDEFSEWEPYLSRSLDCERNPTQLNTQVTPESTLDYQTDAYYRKKGEKRERLKHLARRVIPDLDQRIVVQEMATPLTLYRYTGNTAGATAGWSWNPVQQPKINWRQEGRISGLYLVGAWLLHPGGIPTAMLTGRWVAGKILKEFRGNSG